MREMYTKHFMFASLISLCLIGLRPLPTIAADEQVIQKVTGNGLRNLRPFAVRDKWEIQWDSKGSILSIAIYTADGKSIGLAATQERAGSGSSYQPKGGEYYLQVSGAGEWTVTVVQLP